MIFPHIEIENAGGYDIFEKLCSLQFDFTKDRTSLLEALNMYLNSLQITEKTILAELTDGAVEVYKMQLLKPETLLFPLEKAKLTLDQETLKDVVRKMVYGRNNRQTRLYRFPTDLQAHLVSTDAEVRGIQEELLRLLDGKGSLYDWMTEVSNVQVRGDDFYTTAGLCWLIYALSPEVTLPSYEHAKAAKLAKKEADDPA